VSDSLETEKRTPETAEYYRELYSQASVMEKSFGFIGSLINFPFHVVFSVVKYSIEVVDNSKIIPRTQDFLQSDDGTRELQPTYVSRIGVGVKYYQRQIFNYDSRLRLLAMFGLHNRQRYAVGLERVQLSRLINISNYRVLYEQLTTEPFYGIGADSEKEDKTTYTREFFGADVSLGTDVFRFASLQFYTGFQLNNILGGKSSDHPSTTDIYTTNELPGLGEQVDLLKLEMSLISDSRDRPGKTTSGFQSELSVAYYQQTNASTYQFMKFLGDLRYYLHLFYGRTLMLRFRVESSDAVSGNSIPFYYLSELGEEISFRGFDRGRFRDKDLLMGTLEYRYPVSRNFEAALFVDTGQVTPDIFKTEYYEYWEFAGGIGLRYVSEGGSVSKIELARSKDGFLLKITLN
jgi:hypothetical protein